MTFKPSIFYAAIATRKFYFYKITILVNKLRDDVCKVTN